jgi:hypothetical protein
MRASVVKPRRSHRTTSDSADRSGADACFALAQQASEQAGPARLVLVPSERALCASRDARSSREAAPRHDVAYQAASFAAVVERGSAGRLISLAATSGTKE